MPPKVQISREKILQTALSIVIEEGYEAINIKKIARELGCSTQPISWTFGNMELFRRELFDYTMDYVSKKIKNSSEKPVLNFLSVGEAYLGIAFDQPNIIRYIREVSKDGTMKEKVGIAFDKTHIEDMCQAISDTLDISYEEAYGFITDMVIYNQGIVSLIIDQIVDFDRLTVEKKLVEAGIAHMMYLGVEREKIDNFLS